MDLNTIIEELRQAYMEQDWDSVLESINMLADYNDNNSSDVYEEHKFGDD